MIHERLTARFVVGFFLVLLLPYASATAQEIFADRTLPSELECMRVCMPRCTEQTSGRSASCENRCKRHCGIENTFELKDLRPFLPQLKDLTGVIGPTFVGICGGAACVCNGVDSCNSLIAACPAGFVLQCNKYNDQGQPIACSCVNAG